MLGGGADTRVRVLISYNSEPIRQLSTVKIADKPEKKRPKNKSGAFQYLVLSSLLSFLGPGKPNQANTKATYLLLRE